MGRKLIFLDVDGTLTTPGGYEPPESALRAIKRARDLGHMVFLCSGRNYCMLDIELIETVGTSVCMANGSPKLKEKSDIVCPAVDDDGIEWAFRKLGLVDE